MGAIHSIISGPISRMRCMFACGQKRTLGWQDRAREFEGTLVEFGRNCPNYHLNSPSRNRTFRWLFHEEPC
jgi:hypothetical protein